MSMVSEFFSAFTTDRIGDTEIHLPLSDSAKADLLAILEPAESYIYLTLKGESNVETVKAHADGGYIILVRGLEGTKAVNHHYGTCVTSISPTTIAVLKDLVCNYKCCEGECECKPVELVGKMLPTATIGVEWEGVAFFNGDLPIHIGVHNAPGWMTITQKGATLHMAGTPTETGIFHFTIAAANCGGTAIDSDTVGVIVIEPTPIP